jgi:hypothetical protein
LAVLSEKKGASPHKAMSPIIHAPPPSAELKKTGDSSKRDDSNGAGRKTVRAPVRRAPASLSLLRPGQQQPHPQ